MQYGDARVSTDGQGAAEQLRQLAKAGCGRVFCQAAASHVQLRRALAQLGAGDVLMVTRLDRLARSTRDMLATLAAIRAKEAGLRALDEAGADTAMGHGGLC